MKEESRRKSEELEMLRNSMQQGLVYPPSEPIYSQNPSRREEITHRGLHDFETTTSQIPVDDYVMDFSKPAGYQPPIQERSKEVRRRSIEPTSHSAPQSLVPVTTTQPAPSVISVRAAPPHEAPTLPPAPPLRRRSVNQSRDVIQRSSATSLPTPTSETVPEVMRSISVGVGVIDWSEQKEEVDPTIRQQKSLLMEELRQSANRRILVSEE